MGEGRNGAKLAFAAVVGVAACVLAPVAGADPVYVYVPGPQIIAEATSASGAQVQFFFPTARSDQNNAAVPVSCDHFGGELFGFGLTHVICTATADFVTTRASFEVIVQDTTPPALTVPADTTLEANGPGGRIVSYSATAYDVVDGGRPVTCSKASDTVFPIGVTTVTCTSTDTRSNTGTKTFKVTITDTTAPAITTVPPDQTAEATSSAGAAVTFTTPTATDIVDGSVTSVCTPASGSTFAIGSTKVTCTATDAHGNASSTSFNVMVRDTAPPTITVPHNKIVKARKAKGVKGVKVSYRARAHDLVDGAVTTHCTPASGKTFRIGTTTVKCTAEDAAGNKASKSFRVTVRR
ncbi:MAG: HYR domain-containing protein [Gaiellaceae bacterium]